MKISTNVLLLQILFAVCLSLSVNAQSVLDPNDTVANYDSTHPVAQPAWGQIGKWVRTPKMTWNTNEYKAYIYKGVCFRLKFPKTYNPTAVDGKKYPMLVFFHGLGELGPIIDNESQLLWGAQYFAQSVDDGTYDGYVLLMQSQGFWGTGHYTYLKEIIDYMVANNKLDAFRVVDNGLSAGGQGTWEMFQNYPTYIAAALPMSWVEVAYAQGTTVNQMKFTPFWNFNGGLDGSPAPSTADQVYEAMQDSGANYNNTMYPNVAHDTWNYAWAEPGFWPFVKSACASNPWALHGKTDYCTADSINNIIGLCPGFDAYQWRKDGVLITTATGNTIRVTQPGTYDARVRRGTIWSDWSAVPVKIRAQCPVPPPPPPPTIRVEAENYSAMSGIQTENASDLGGTQDVGWQDNGDWMDYKIYLANAGTYTVNFRVATVNTGVTFQVKNESGNVLALVTVPNTGGWQTYQSVAAQITLPAGAQTIRIQTLDSKGSGWNFNWWQIENASANTATATRIEAENYMNMNGIQTENTGDPGGGQDVGWQDNNDWMDYALNLAAPGTFTVNFRVATVNTGVKFQVKKPDGTVLAMITVPNTGGWQTYQTISAQIALPAGQQTIRIYTYDAKGSGWNFNWWEIYAPTAAIPVTSKVEAESYTAMSGVQTENTADTGGGLDVGWQENNDWMDYSVNVGTAGNYNVSFRVATPNNGVQFQLRKPDGTVLATINAPNTGGWQAFQNVSAVVALPAGQQTLRIVTTNDAGSGWNINWWQLTPTTETAPPPSTVYSQKIEAENYTAMSGIQTENASDVGGTLDVGWQENGDWMDYSVNIPAAGTYTVSFRVATVNTGVQFQLKNTSGSVLTTMTVPNTGWWQTYQTVSGQVTLPAGQQTLRIYTYDAKGSGWNINWWQITNVPPSAQQVSPQAFATELVTTEPESLQLYPNPVISDVLLQLDNQHTGVMHVRVVDMNGRERKEIELNKPAKGLQQTHIQLGDLPAGQYLIQISIGNWSETRKVIKR